MISLRGYTLTHPIESIGSVQGYTGVRDEDGQQVIAKVYRPDDDPELATAMERHYHLVSEIESDGIVQTLALERTGEVLVLVTEAFEGLTIGEYAARHSITTDIFLTIAVQLSHHRHLPHHRGPTLAHPV